MTRRPDIFISTFLATSLAVSACSPDRQTPTQSLPPTETEPNHALVLTQHEIETLTSESTLEPVETDTPTPTETPTPVPAPTETPKPSIQELVQSDKETAISMYLSESYAISPIESVNQVDINILPKAYTQDATINTGIDNDYIEHKDNVAIMITTDRVGNVVVRVHSGYHHGQPLPAEDFRKFVQGGNNIIGWVTLPQEETQKRLDALLNTTITITQEGVSRTFELVAIEVVPDGNQTMQANDGQIRTVNTLSEYRSDYSAIPNFLERFAAAQGRTTPFSQANQGGYLIVSTSGWGQAISGDFEWYTSKSIVLLFRPIQ